LEKLIKKGRKWPYLHSRRMMMLRIISKALLCTAVIAIVALFAATQAVAEDPLGDGTCDQQLEAPKFHCFEDAGYVVEILEPFPEIVNGYSVFRYLISAEGTLEIDYINLLISAGVVPESTTPTDFKLFTDAQGDVQSKFGKGLTLDNTIRWHKYDAMGGEITLTVNGIVGVSNKAMGLITSTDYRKWAIGEILGPGEVEQPPRVVAEEECISFVEIESETYPGVIEAISAKAKRDSAACIIEESLDFYKTKDCSGAPTPHTFDPADPDLVVASGNFDGCSELVEVRKSSPVCVYLTLTSGRKTRVCW
jgi:hypothetical protein